MGLAVLAGVPLIALIPAAYAAKHPVVSAAPKHTGGDPAPKHTGGGAAPKHTGGDPAPPNVRPLIHAAGVQTVELLHEQALAIQRNQHFLQQQQKFNAMLMRLEQTVPQNPQQAALIQQQIRLNSAALAHVNQNIALSRLHLLNTLPGVVDRVYHLLNVLPTLAPNGQHVANFVALAEQRQLSALTQLMGILNQEIASQTTPGP
jgi:hypothetical protein